MAAGNTEGMSWSADTAGVVAVADGTAADEVADEVNSGAPVGWHWERSGLKNFAAVSSKNRKNRKFN